MWGVCGVCVGVCGCGWVGVGVGRGGCVGECGELGVKK